VDSLPVAGRRDDRVENQGNRIPAHLAWSRKAEFKLPKRTLSKGLIEQLLGRLYSKIRQPRGSRPSATASPPAPLRYLATAGLGAKVKAGKEILVVNERLAN
jgi:hypothetical protein